MIVIFSDFVLSPPLFTAVTTISIVEFPLRKRRPYARKWSLSRRKARPKSKSISLNSEISLQNRKCPLSTLKFPSRTKKATSFERKKRLLNGKSVLFSESFRVQSRSHLTCLASQSLLENYFPEKAPFFRIQIATLR